MTYLAYNVGRIVKKNKVSKIRYKRYDKQVKKETVASLESMVTHEH